MNNVEYYSYFDTAVNAHLIEVCGLDIHNASIISLVVETKCQFKKSLCFPDVVGRASASPGWADSVTYEMAVPGRRSGARCLRPFRPRLCGPRVANPGAHPGWFPVRDGKALALNCRLQPDLLHRRDELGGVEALVEPIHPPVEVRRSRGPRRRRFPWGRPC